MLSTSQLFTIIGYLSMRHKPTSLQIFFFVFLMKMLLWQASVATNPHVFVIATCFWSEMIIYLLVSCNKQLFSWFCRARHLSCFYTLQVLSVLCNKECVKTRQMSCPLYSRGKLLITTYQEVNDLTWSNTCCDDENVRAGGNTSLPEQHFLFNSVKEKPW